MDYLFKELMTTLSNSGCPICKESKGEKEIRKYLLKNNINFISQN